MRSRFLVSASWLEDHLDDPDLRVFDTSAELRFDPVTGRTEVTSGRDEWQRGHIPGAGFVDLIELCDPSAPGEYMIPSAEHFAHEMSALGVGARSRVVVYDSGAAMFATRLWWMLRVFGFDAVSVLDGGLREWRRGGRPLSDGAASYPAARFTPRFRPELVATLADVEAQVASGEGLLVNALSPEMFRGEGTVGYRRPGRIPGSVNVPYYSLLGPEGRFRDPERLGPELTAPGLLDRTQRVVTYCGGGLAATTVAFGLALTGREDVAVYDGSLNEWTARPERPVEVG